MSRYTYLRETTPEEQQIADALIEKSIASLPYTLAAPVKQMFGHIAANEFSKAMNYALDLRDCTIEELRIPIDGAFKPITYAGMAVQEIDWKTCREAFWDYLQSSFLVMDED